MFIRLANVPIDCRASPKNLTETKAETVLLKFICGKCADGHTETSARKILIVLDK